MFYIVSLVHTLPRDKYITLWGPNNAGYNFSKQLSGLYETPTPGYHDSEINMPITQELVDILFKQVEYEGRLKDMIPNEPKYWKALGVRMSKKQKCLVRKVVKSINVTK